MERRENGFYTEGINIERLAAKYGTPLYVYSADKIRRQYELVKSALGPEKLRIMYACKALTNLSILRYIRKLGAGLDAVSTEELELGLMAGFRGEDIIFTPSMVGPEDYDFAVKKGVKINVGDLEALRYMGEKHAGYPVCIRLNPHIYAGGHDKISVGHEHSKFGISIHHMEEILRTKNSLSIDVEGLHIHAGSDIESDEQYLRAIEVLFAQAVNFPGLKYVDIGSGFKVPYQGGTRGSDLQMLGEFVRKKRKELEGKLSRELMVFTEPGKILVSECGLFLATVASVKKGPNRTFAGLNTGFNHLMRPMLYDAQHLILNISNPDGPLVEYDVVGYICETDDFAKGRKLPELKPEDLVAFMNAGAYGFNMASNYNSKMRPPEVLIFEGKDYLIRRRENLNDLLSTHVEPGIF